VDLTAVKEGGDERGLESWYADGIAIKTNNYHKCKKEV
jgi:hypothetical protein